MVKQVDVWHGDANVLLPNLPRDIDLLLADPPYGKEYKSNRTDAGETIEGDDHQDEIDENLRYLWHSRMRPHRHAYVFGPRRDFGPAATADLVWDKLYNANGSSEWGRSHDTITFYAHRYRSEPTAGELAARLRKGSVIREAAPRGSVEKNHPNMKPVRLWQRFIESSTNVGDLVVDPYCGGGSSGVAARLLGRRWIGIEIDPVYSARAEEWVGEIDRQLRRMDL